MMRLGDLVSAVGVFEKENLTGIIVKGPYPAVFTIEDGITIFTEEALAVDLVCSGKIYSKVKCDLLKKID